MGKIDNYREYLRKNNEWDEFLLNESGLPGPRANLELVQAVVDEGEEDKFLKYLSYNEEKAPTNSPYEFLAMCGVVGLGKLLVEGKTRYFHVLKEYASDSRWRIRESVAMALQTFGKVDMKTLLKVMEEWAEGNLLEKRAVIAALCEPILLKKPEEVIRILELLHKITTLLIEENNRKSDDFKTLRKALAYCWSVAVAALPKEGKNKMEYWLTKKDKDIIWIMKENLEKSRLIKMDEQWVEKCKGQLRGEK